MTAAKEANPKRISILWVSFTILDVYLHKTALLHILRQFAEFGHKPCLIAVRSRNASQIEDPRVRIVSVPLRYVPVVSPIMFTIVLFIYLPVFIIISSPILSFSTLTFIFLVPFPVFLFPSSKR